MIPKSLTILMLLFAIFSLSACNGEDDEDNNTPADSGGSDASTSVNEDALCDQLCEIAETFACPGDNPATCNAQCHAYWNHDTCTKEIRAYFNCMVQVGQEDWECDEDESMEAVVKEGFCDTEEIALDDCLETYQ